MSYALHDFRFYYEPLGSEPKQRRLRKPKCTRIAVRAIGIPKTVIIRRKKEGEQ